MLNALRRLFLYLLLAVIVMTAFSSLMLRLLTPMLGEYRTDIEQWASQLIQQPISIESIDAKIVGFTPQLKLTGVELLDINREFPIARFGGLSIHFGLLNSLIYGNLSLDHIELHGLDISLVRGVDGKVSVSGLGGVIENDPTENQNEQSERAGRGFGAWLLQQEKVSLYKSHLRWLDMRQQHSFDFPDISVTLRNSGNRHSIYTLIELPEQLGGELEVDLNLNGDIFDNQSWGGKLYLRAEAFNGRTILNRRIGKDWKLQQGNVDGEFWGEIVAGRLEQLQGRLQAKRIKLNYQDRALPLSQFDTQMLLKKIDSGWQLQLTGLNFGGALRGKMPHQLQLKQDDSGWRVNVDRFNLSVLPPVLAAVKPELIDKDSKISGELRALEMFYATGQGVELFGSELNNIHVTGITGLPAVAGLFGHAGINNKVLTLVVNSPTLGLQIPQLFENRLPPLAVSGKVSAAWDSGSWQLWSEQLNLNNGDLNLKLSTNIQSRVNEKPHVAISADIGVAKINRLKHYVPGNILTEGTANWLREAFHNGQLQKGKLLIYGRGKDIVNRSRGGRLEIALEPKGLDLQFHKKWPQIKAIDADIRFSGQQMTITSKKGKTLSSGVVDDVVVKIEDFRSPLLTVDGLVHFDARDGLRYISISPLKNILGDVGETIEASGTQALKLHLGVPLGRKHKQSKDGVSVKAALDFQDVALNIDKQLKIDKIAGVLAFNQYGVERSNLNAELFERPVKIAIYKRRMGVNESTFVTTQGRLDAQKLIGDIKMPWARKIEGMANMKATLEFNQSKKSVVLIVDSNLNGVESKLPHPVNKKSSEALALKMKYYFKGKKQKQIDLTLGERLSAQIKLPKRGRVQQDIHIHLGSEKLTPSNQKGLLFTGQLSQLDVERWMQLLPNSSDVIKSGGFDMPIRIKMKRLHILEKGETTGKIEKVSGKLKPSSLPALTVDINALSYGSLQLGGVVLVTKPARKTMSIRKLVVSDGNHKLTANGSWKRSSGTALDVKVTAKDLGRMLKTLKFDTPMKKGKLSAKGKLRWSSSPMDFKLSRINGNLKVNVKEGFIEDVSSDAGQLLELFNVRKVLNRILLDFSDLKEKTLTYKDLSGNFSIKRGNIHTSDFKLISAPATMLLTGRTGLVKEDYDLHLSVIPQISDAVPVAGTLVFGPQVAVALLAFRKLFGKEFDKASMQQYRISGSWDDPKVKKIEPKLAEDKK